MTAMSTAWERDLDEALAEILAKYPRYGGPPSCKTIFFARHAQSKSNVAKREPICGGRLALLRQGFNSELSPLGELQLLAVRPATLEISSSSGLQAVLHSPLDRAAKTALAMFGEEMEEGEGREEKREGGGLKPQRNLFWRPLKALKEKRAKEYMGSKDTIRKRSAAVVRFLSLLPWDCCALVGHSHLFRLVLRHMGGEVRIANANVWRVTVSMTEEREECPLRCEGSSLVAWPAGLESNATAEEVEEVEIGEEEEDEEDEGDEEEQHEQGRDHQLRRESSDVMPLRS